jgi:hypothetical protein
MIDGLHAGPLTLEEMATRLEGLSQEIDPERRPRGHSVMLIEELRNLAASAKILANLWSQERAVLTHLGDSLIKAKIMSPPRMMLLYFHLDGVEGSWVDEAISKGSRPEAEMTETLNRLAEEGWRVAYRHYDPKGVPITWRIIMEKS